MASKTRQQQFYEMLLESQFWPAERMQAFQRSQMEQFVRHARANVPFYKDRLGVLFRPSGEIDWDRWRDIPITRRSDLADRAQDLLAFVAPEAHGEWTTVQTSGSTGKPLVVTTSQLATAAANANRYRAYGWHGLDWSRNMLALFGETDDDAPWPTGRVRGPWGPPWDPATPLGTLRRLNRLSTAEQIADYVRRTDTAYLVSGIKTAVAFALESERLGLNVTLDALLCQSTTVDDTDREVIERIFGSRTIELYSSKEGGQMAHGCPDGDGLHLNSETVFVEILREDGTPCEAGEIGRVVITPFFNSAQPLIRYEQGDIAHWLPPCTCGRHLPRLGSLIGRTSGLFHHPDGRVRAAFISPADKLLIGARDWQIAQVGPHAFEVRYVQFPGFTGGDEATIVQHIREAIFADADVRFVQIAAMPLGPGGKHAEYVNEWKPVRPLSHAALS